MNWNPPALRYYSFSYSSEYVPTEVTSLQLVLFVLCLFVAFHFEDSGNKNRDSCPCNCMTHENPCWHKTNVEIRTSAPLLSSTRAHLGPPTEPEVRSEVRTLGLDCMELTEAMKPSDNSICIKPPDSSASRASCSTGLKSSLCKMWTWRLNFFSATQLFFRNSKLKHDKVTTLKGLGKITSWHLLTLVRFYCKQIMQHI